MIRRVLLVVMATVVSLSLAALSGYLLYTVSAGRSEIHLWLMARFIISPVIAILTGVLVGLLSKDHPIPTLIIGLAPWIFNLFGPERPALLGPGPVYIALGTIAALVVFRMRQRHKFAKMANVSPSVPIARENQHLDTTQ
jgi:hypothetical protein